MWKPVCIRSCSRHRSSASSSAADSQGPAGRREEWTRGRPQWACGRPYGGQRRCTIWSAVEDTFSRERAVGLRVGVGVFWHTETLCACSSTFGGQPFLVSGCCCPNPRALLDLPAQGGGHRRCAIWSGEDTLLWETSEWGGGGQRGKYNIVFLQCKIWPSTISGIRMLLPEPPRPPVFAPIPRQRSPRPPTGPRDSHASGVSDARVRTDGEMRGVRNTVVVQVEVVRLGRELLPERVDRHFADLCNTQRRQSAQTEPRKPLGTIQQRRIVNPHNCLKRECPWHCVARCTQVSFSWQLNFSIKW